VSAADIIAANEQAIAAAQVSLDLEAIDRLYHPEFVVVQPDGIIETKAEVLESDRSVDGTGIMPKSTRCTSRLRAARPLPSAAGGREG
jgi:hypothetical protein